MFRVFSRMLSTARTIVERNVHLRSKMKSKKSKVGGKADASSSSTVLPAMSMVYLIGMHYRCSHDLLPPQDLELSEEERQEKYERTSKNLVKKLGLKPEQVSYNYCARTSAHEFR
ncbi:hypothetical protein MKW94_015112 [Papaver nudicaule]|uniref:Uncharacterized protein n=1 Tax=Papaver nudicaule TaxID=74823 RepID=A0AA41SFM7_PAPNU|nr:hypothetical protein [Papaver nudicaule]